MHTLLLLLLIVRLNTYHNIMILIHFVAKLFNFCPNCWGCLQIMFCFLGPSQTSDPGPLCHLVSAFVLSRRPFPYNPTWGPFSWSDANY